MQMELALPLSSHRAAELGGVTIDHDAYFCKVECPDSEAKEKAPTTAKISNNTGDASRLAL
ncbi:hypothetical protein [Mesorhizobium sp. L48C026A00]|uniref:hypothetical protein n=1 Tax=Mesorhizobium sp. L48C026A00 TaxID=1287182 RepID=UPI0003D021D1|nr:hypothetical protein [Mesorhizobium sp. L48C026A00]ESZ15276.1 hypothetical protein X737_22350 [Mesorhizobium sp. L48C026A00]